MNEMKRLLDDTTDPELLDLLRSADIDTEAASASQEARVLAAVARLPTAGRRLHARCLMSLAGEPARSDRFWRVAKWTLPLLCVGLAGTITIASMSLSRSDASRMVAEAPADLPSVARTAAREQSADVPSPAPEATVSRIEDLPTVPLDTKLQGGASPSTETARVNRSGQSPPVLNGVSRRSAGEGSRGANIDTNANAQPSQAQTSLSDRPALDDELAAIDAARASLATAQPARVLSQVEDYRRNFAAPQFMDEAVTLEIQALKALGRVEEARQKGAAFLAQHPRSPYARRVRSAIDLKE